MSRRHGRSKHSARGASIVLVVVFMLGLFDIEHTWYWSLDELSYGILFIVAGYF